MINTTSSVARVRKNMDMDPVKLAAAREILGVKSDTEAVDLALDRIVFPERVAQILDAISERGGWDSPFVRAEELATSARRSKRK